MCQCGCADYSPERQYRLKGCIVGIELYPGCENCTETLGIVPHFFTPKSGFAQGHKTVKVTPDEEGALLPPIKIMEVKDLRESFKAMDVQYDPSDPDGYATLDDYLNDYGLRILQEAIRLCRDRARKEANTNLKGGSEPSFPKPC